MSETNMSCVDCTEICTVLGKIYELEQIDEWFDTPQLALDGQTPTAAISIGEYDRVLTVAKAAAEFTYL